MAGRPAPWRDPWTTADGGPVLTHRAVFFVLKPRSNAMAWIYLLVAGLFEIVWAIGLKYTEGWTRLWPSLGTLAAMVVSFWCLSQSLKSIPIGTGYAIWTGIGAVGAAALGILLFGDSASWPRLLCIGLIVSGVIGLKMVS